MGANGFLLLMMGVIFIYQQFKIWQIHAIILSMQAMMIPKVAGMEFLVLRAMTVASITANHVPVEAMVWFGNNYWVVMFGLLLTLLVVYKGIKRLLRLLPQSVGSTITHSTLVLQVFITELSVYIRLVQVDGIHSQITIRSEEGAGHLAVIGYLFPSLTIVWNASLENNTRAVCTHKRVPVKGATTHIHDGIPHSNVPNDGEQITSCKKRGRRGKYCGSGCPNQPEIYASTIAGIASYTYSVSIDLFNGTDRDATIPICYSPEIHPGHQLAGMLHHLVGCLQQEPTLKSRCVQCRQPTTRLQQYTQYRNATRMSKKGRIRKS